MKVGSIVVVIPNPMQANPDTPVKWLPKDDGETPYEIRGFGYSSFGQIAFFQEGVIGMNAGREVGITIKVLKEILPPCDFKELENAMNQKVPLELVH